MDPLWGLKRRQSEIETVDNPDHDSTTKRVHYKSLTDRVLLEWHFFSFKEMFSFREL